MISWRSRSNERRRPHSGTGGSMPSGMSVAKRSTWTTHGETSRGQRARGATYPPAGRTCSRRQSPPLVRFRRRSCQTLHILGTSSPSSPPTIVPAVLPRQFRHLSTLETTLGRLLKRHLKRILTRFLKRLLNLLLTQLSLIQIQ